MNYLDRPHLTARQVKRRIQSKDVAKVATDLISEGWTAVDAGHCIRVVCPCREGDGPISISIGSTIANPTWAARRIRRDAQRCPDEHEKIQARGQ